MVTRMLRSPAVRWWTRIRFSSASARRGVMIWSVEVGIVDVGGAELVGDDGFDDCGEHADGDVATDALFGPVVDGPQAENVFHHGGIGVRRWPGSGSG